jgi:hypothetical protein
MEDGTMHRGDENLDPDIRRDAEPGKTPGKAEGGEERHKPFPNQPGKTPGSAEGEDIYDDPGTKRGPDPDV